jgi:uncharacterized membrane protein YqjE
MSDEAEVNAAMVQPAAEIDVIELEERRAKRDLKHWLVRTITVTMMFVFVVCIMSLLYAAVVQEKDLNTTFIGEMFKIVFDFLRFVMS